jgi:hypothetical protein
MSVRASLHRKDFVAQLLAVLMYTGATPQRPKIKLTESLLVPDVEAITPKIGLWPERYCTSDGQPKNAAFAGRTTATNLPGFADSQTGLVAGMTGLES